MNQTPGPQSMNQTPRPKSMNQTPRPQSLNLIKTPGLIVVSKALRELGENKKNIIVTSYHSKRGIMWSLTFHTF